MSALVDVIMQVDRNTWICILLMAAGGAALVSINIGSGLYMLYFFPGLVAGGLAFRLMAQHYEFAISSDKVIDNIAIITLGGILSLLTLMSLLRFVKAMSDWMTPAPKRDPREMTSLIGRRI